MRVLIVSDYLYPWTSGGVSTQVYSLARALHKRGIVGVLTPNWTAIWLKEKEKLGVRNWHLRMYGPTEPGKATVRTTAMFLVTFPIVILQLLRLLRTQQVNIVHINYVQPNQIYFLLLALLGGPPYILTFRGTDLVEAQSHDRFTRFLLKLFVAKASAVTTVGLEAAEHTSLAFPWLRRVHVIRNGLGLLPDETTSAGEQPRVPDRFFLTAGGLHPIKGDDLVVRAWVNIAKDFEKLDLVLIGDKGRRQEFEHLIYGLGLSSRVFLLGEVTRRTVIELMRKSTGVIVASKREGLSNVVLEAGAAGVPVIGSNVPGIREIIRHGETGLLLTERTPKAVEFAVRQLVTEKGLRTALAKALRRRVYSEFSTDRVTKDYLRLYREVGGRGTSKQK